MIEEVSMHFLESVNREQEKIIRFLKELNLRIFFRWIVRSHHIVAFHQFLFERRVFLLILKKLTNIIRLSSNFLFLPEIVVFSSIVPWRRIVPNISSIIQDNMIFCSIRKYVLHWFSVQATVLVTTYHSVRQKAFRTLKKFERFFIPSWKVRKRLSSPLSSHPFAYLVSINPCSFGIDIHFE